MQKITIVGCGHGGQALAFDLTSKGCEVTLCALPDHPGAVHQLKETKEITCSGILEGTQKIHNITVNLSEAISSAELIFFVVPSFAQEQVLLACLPYFKDNQWIITLEANFACLAYTDLLKRINFDKALYFADISTLPYACRSNEPGQVHILGIKKKMGIAAMPHEKTDTIAQILNKIFPSELTSYHNSIEIGLNSLSGILHPAVALCNAGRIGKDEFYFYRDGISPAVADLIEQLEVERQKIGQLYDLDLPYCMDIEEEFYSIKYDNVYDFFSNSQIHSGKFTLCPSSLKERYISQDIPYVIVPWYSLGAALGYEARIMKNLIDMSSALNRYDYLAKGRNLLHMNCHDLEKVELIHYANHGCRVLDECVWSVEQ